MHNSILVIINKPKKIIYYELVKITINKSRFINMIKGIIKNNYDLFKYIVIYMNFLFILEF